MAFKHYRLLLLYRILLLTLSIFLLLFMGLHTTLYGIMVIVALSIIMQIVSLFRILDTTNYELARFFQAMQYADFTRSFTPKLTGKSFKDLNSALSQVMQQINKNREEKEEQYRYLQTIVQHIGIGLIVFDDTGSIDLVNNAARRILNMSNIRNIEKLKNIDSALVNRITAMQHNERDIIKLKINEEIQQIMLFITDFIMHQRNFRLISFQNIQSELEEKELEAWQSLIRVLTHEIMNSITPISSLASTANSLLTHYSRDANVSEQDADTLQDIGKAVETIEKRSRGLLNFVENYRKLTRIPKPDYKIIRVHDLFDRIEMLFKAQLAEKAINFTALVEPDGLELTADNDLIDQVLINLVKNAIEAVQQTEHPEINISGSMDLYGLPVIRVTDNGSGIKKEILDHIFIPFFTTKSNGSGIGLSLSRQIMRLHGGSIAASMNDDKTVFTLKFK